LALADAAAEAVAQLRSLADCWKSHRADDIAAATVVFGQACANMAACANKANLFPVIARRGDAGLAVLSLLVERISLGLNPGSFDRVTGESVPVPESEVFEEIADSVREIDSLELPARIVAYLEDEDVAPLAVGAHVAREGQNDPFCGHPWMPPDLGVSLAAAAIAAAVLIHVAQALEVGPEAFGSLLEQGSASLIKAAGAAYLALDQEERAALSGFGVASQVIEEILDNSDFLTELSGADAHRVSAKLGAAFAAGFGQQSVDDLEAEPGETAKALLLAAGVCGFVASHDEGLMLKARTHRHRRSAFGVLPGIDKLQ